MANNMRGCDAHKRYSQISALDRQACTVERSQVEHPPGAFKEYLIKVPRDTPVAVECVGNGYWIVEGIRGGAITSASSESTTVQVLEDDNVIISARVSDNDLKHAKLLYEVVLNHPPRRSRTFRRYQGNATAGSSRSF